MSANPSGASDGHDGARGGRSSSAPADVNWDPATSRSAAFPAHSSGYRDLLLLEKKRKARELAAGELNSALLEETLSALRAKAQALQDDRWMYEDVQL